MAPRNYRDALAAAQAAGADPQNPDDGAAALGDAGKRALDRLKRQNADLKARAETAEAKVKEYDDANLSDQDKRDRDLDGFRTRAETAERALLLRDVGEEKGLTAAQAKRLQGATREELEADADDLLATFPAPKPAADPDPAPPPRLPGRPTERPRGGGNPDEPPDEMDPRKLAANVSRR